MECTSLPRAKPGLKLLGDQVDYLRVFVNQLRKKIEPTPSTPVYLLTEPWVGYRLQLAGRSLESAQARGRDGVERRSWRLSGRRVSSRTAI